jgi:hypothetical protein
MVWTGIGYAACRVNNAAIADVSDERCEPVYSDEAASLPVSIKEDV